MPRAPSIHLEVARVLRMSIDRFKYRFDDPTYIPSKDDAQTLVYLAQADKHMRGRTTTEEEAKEAEELEAKELDPRELTERLRREAMTPLPPNNVREDVDT